MSVYAYVHTSCRHLSSEHRLVSGAPSVDGPYACMRCDCMMSQSDPQHGLSRAQFKAKYGKDAN